MEGSASLLGLSWQALGIQMWPKRVPIIEGEQFFFLILLFSWRDFHFSSIWEGLGRVGGKFLEVWGRILSGFREFRDHFYIDFYNFYRFRGATLLS